MKHAYQGDLFETASRRAQGLISEGDQLCEKAHYAAVVDAVKDVEIYQLGDVDCPSCLRRMAAKHAAIAAVFRARLEGATGATGGLAERCRVNDSACIDPSYCDALDTCRAGDMNIVAIASTSPQRLCALCHECSEVVDVTGGMLDPHHGDTGDGCPQNGARAQIYLHPRVAARIAELEASIAFGGER